MSKRRGLAAVELVSGVAVVLMGAALMLPAISQARDAARRQQCVNNLKQIGLATHNYLAVTNVFPMSVALGGKGHGIGHGCFAMLLPYMELAPLYNSCNFSVEAWHPANSTTVSFKVTSFVCPANPNDKPTAAAEIRTHEGQPYPGKTAFAPGHYGANWGGVREASGAGLAKGYPNPEAPGSHLGVVLAVVDPDAKAPTRNVNLADITDGTFSTVAFVEKRDGFGWGVGGWGGTEFDVNESIAYDGDDAKLRRAFTGSYHPEGVHVLFADGGVAMVRPTIDRALWQGMTTRNRGEPIFKGVRELREP